MFTGNDDYYSRRDVENARDEGYAECDSLRSKVRGMRVVLRTVLEYLDYVEEFVPAGIPPITHTRRMDSIADAFAIARQHVAELETIEGYEKQAAERKRQQERASAVREIAELNARIKELDEAARAAKENRDA